MNTNKLNLMAALVFGTLVLAASSSANAFDLHGHGHDHGHYHGGHGGIWIGGGGGTVVERSYVSGHYETRIDTVMVSPAHYETQVLPAQFQTSVDVNGKLVTLQVAPASTQTLLVPARYESREVSVWVPGFYSDSSYYSGGGVRVGVGFRF